MLVRAHDRVIGDDPHRFTVAGIKYGRARRHVFEMTAGDVNLATQQCRKPETKFHRRSKPLPACGETWAQQLDQRSCRRMSPLPK